MAAGEHIQLQTLNCRANVEGTDEDGQGLAKHGRCRRPEATASDEEMTSVIILQAIQR